MDVEPLILEELGVVDVEINENRIAKAQVPQPVLPRPPANRPGRAPSSVSGIVEMT